MTSRSAAATVLVGLLLISLTACASSQGPTYASVRADTQEAIADIVAALPAGAAYTPSGDPTSTPCGTSTAEPAGPEGTAFATLHGSAVLPGTADAAAVVTDLPLTLGEDWAVEPVGIDTDVATVRVNRAETGVSVDVTEQAGDGPSTLDILAVSPCGRVD
ncbi:hypothetical protein [Microbacterium oleivorans]|uniref:hypothetical protein n=1 Tax=Microbacterium oleivorans TaxID=273677 RepID=UPI00080E593F|nr:hypothetical protein [Microbacterium oleivorans]